MNNEKEFKTLFKKSVRAYQGFSLSLAAPMIVGVPDLYVILPGYMPILLEAKFLGEIKREKFSRTIPFTAMQMTWIESCHNINPYSAMGLVGFNYKDLLYAVLVAYGTPMFYQLSSCFLTDCSYVTRNVKGVFDVAKLFQGVPIPRLIQQKPKDEITTHEQKVSILDALGNTTGLTI